MGSSFVTTDLQVQLTSFLPVCVWLPASCLACLPWVRSLPLLSCLPGKLLEVNQRLLQEPRLLLDR